MEINWCGYQVTVYEGKPSQQYDLGDDFPWISTAGDRLDVVIASKSCQAGEDTQTTQVGIDFNDLITTLIKTEMLLGSGQAMTARNQAISALKSAIHRLQTEPLQNDA